MLEKSDTNIGDTLASFAKHNLDVALLVPTETGMKKSIMDATASVRAYLKASNFHDFEAQNQGPAYKEVRKAYFVYPDHLEETTVSLYRPVTKSGDPRIWIGKMGKYAEPHNLLALLIQGDALYVINCSIAENLPAMGRGTSPLQEIIDANRPVENPAVAELLGMIAEISKKGFVPNLRIGDTGVGMTLETLLGIAANPRRTPDFKGIEIKAKRVRGRRHANRVTLFSQVPNWQLSPIESAWNLLSTYGYRKTSGDKLRLNHEINSQAPNSIGFMLAVDAANDWLRQNYVDKESNKSKHVITWEIEKLRSRLVEKHPQTFWVEAMSRGARDAEEFHYTKVVHTKSPNIRNFESLLEGGLISVDYLMSAKNEERKVVRDHGYLFKIHPHNFKALFPPPVEYSFV